MNPTTVKMLLPVLCTVWGIQQDDEHTYWATAAHCVPSIGQVVVIDSPSKDGKRIEARVISKDTETDTAVLKTWTRDVGPISVAQLNEPRPGPATVHTHRGDIFGTITDRNLHIRGLTPRRIATARVIPGDSGSAIEQEDAVVGLVSHTVNGCETGFCPVPPEQAAKGLSQQLVTGDPLGITLRDIIAAICGYFGIRWYQTPKPTAAD